MSLCLTSKLKENIRWKALDEIYKIYMLLYRSDLNIVKLFLIFSKILQNCRGQKRTFFIEFCSEFDELLSEFRNFFENHDVEQSKIL